MVAGRSKAVCGATTLTYGQQVGTDGSGDADRKIAGTDTDEYICGFVSYGAADGEMAEVVIDCRTPATAVTNN